MRTLMITTQIGLILFIVSVLYGCSKQEVSPPAHHHSARHAHQELAKTNRYDWKISTQEPIQTGKPNILYLDLKEHGTNAPLKDLSILHEKLAHLIIVSRDLSYFAHVHPDVVGPGKMSVQTTLPKEGQYMTYLQIYPTGKEEVTLSQALQVGQVRSTNAQLIPDADQVKALNGYTFWMQALPNKANVSAMPKLIVEKDGKPVEKITPYLGAGGHAVIISEDTQTFLHVHPVSEAKNGLYQSPLVFHTVIPKSGLYKLWVQFQLNDKIETVDFAFEVK